MSLLLIISLVNKNIAVLFMPGKPRSYQSRRRLVNLGLRNTRRRRLLCEPCENGSYRCMFSGSLTSADDSSTSDVSMLHVDTKGKVDTPSANGNLHFLTIIDELSRYILMYPMKKKVEASELLLNFIIPFENNPIIQSKQYIAIVVLNVFVPSTR